MSALFERYPVIVSDKIGAQDLPAENEPLVEIQPPKIVDLDNWFVAVSEVPALDESVAVPPTQRASQRSEPCFTLTPPDAIVRYSQLDRDASEMQLAFDF